MSATTSLLDAVTAVTAAKKSSGSSTRNPQWYNAERKRLIIAMVNHENPVVRVATVENENVPTTDLKKRLLVETEESVLRALLSNPKMPAKSIIEFAGDERATVLAEDKEFCAMIASRCA